WTALPPGGRRSPGHEGLGALGDAGDAFFRGVWSMFRLDLGSTPRYCDGMNRRSFLQLGVAGLASVGLPQLLRAREESAGPDGSRKDTAVILLWLDGGPSPMDPHDMKPHAHAANPGHRPP